MKQLGIEHPRRPVCCKFGSVLYLLGSHWFSPFEDLDVQRKFLSRWRICLCSLGQLIKLPVGVPKRNIQKIQRKLVLFERTSRVSCQLAGSNKVSGLHGNLSAIALLLWVWPWFEQDFCRCSPACKEFPTSVKSMQQPSDVMKRTVLTCSNITRSQNTPAKPTSLLGKVERCIWDRFQTWVHPMSRLSKVTAEKTKRAHPIKHLHLSCKPALRFGLDRKCCYGLRRVGGGHWWRQRRSGQQNHEMNALPRSDGSKLPFFRLEACTNRDHCAPRQFAQRIWFDASLQLNDVSLWSFWIHNWYWIVWQQDCKLCRALARCLNNCITSVSLTTVWTRLLQVQSRATIFHENHVMGCTSSSACG